MRTRGVRAILVPRAGGPPVRGRVRRGERGRAARGTGGREVEGESETWFEVARRKSGVRARRRRCAFEENGLDALGPDFGARKTQKGAPRRRYSRRAKEMDTSTRRYEPGTSGYEEVRAGTNRYEPVRDAGVGRLDIPARRDRLTSKPTDGDRWGSGRPMASAALQGAPYGSSRWRSGQDTGRAVAAGVDETARIGSPMSATSSFPPAARSTDAPSISSLVGVGPTRAKALAELGVNTVDDLLEYFRGTTGSSRRSGASSTSSPTRFNRRAGKSSRPITSRRDLDRDSKRRWTTGRGSSR
jgi:hypothetical protein